MLAIEGLLIAASIEIWISARLIMSINIRMELLGYDEFVQPHSASRLQINLIEDIYGKWANNTKNLVSYH
jgi:hypothetical protein